VKILIITTRFYPHIGGVEEVVANVARNLSRDNEVKVLSSLDNRTGFSNMPKILRITLPEESFDTYSNKKIWMNLPGSFFGWILFPARFFLALIELFSYVQKFKPDVINYHFPDDSSIYIDLLTSVIRTPVVVNIHGNDLQKYSQKKLHKHFIRPLLNRSAKIIVNSSYMKAEFLKSFPNLTEKIKIIPNGLNLDLYKNAKAKKYVNEEYIFYVGRLVEKKGVDLLVKAFYKMGNSNLKMMIEGKGEELTKIKQMVKGLGIDPQFIFTEGTLSASEKIAAMKGALFGVIPSRIEPFGIVALEYMAAEIPFVASKTGGLNDLLRDNETCLFFENGNFDDLSRKMELMLSDKELRDKLSTNGKIEVKNYRWEAISNRYYSCFEEVI
jgi:glycogen(starch) synthase